MKELEKKETPEITGGALATPYPTGATTPPYVPSRPETFPSGIPVECEDPLRTIDQ